MSHRMRIYLRVMLRSTNLLSEASNILNNNNQGLYTMPAADLYPHQWLWDSCFIAIGLRHLDINRAQTEILSLLRGQWLNGMLPNIIFSTGDKYSADRELWRSWLSPNAPAKIATSGITQPPMVAEAVIKIGEKLSPLERRIWYRRVYPSLVKYHEWLYAERDPHQEGLVLSIHPWEIGMDNTPPWIAELSEHQLNSWIRTIKKLHLDNLISHMRRDTKNIPSFERFGTVELLAMFSIQWRLRRKAYDISRILDHSLFAIEDVAFNAILIRNNHHLQNIAKTIRIPLNQELIKRMKKTEHEFNRLWDTTTSQYHSRDFITHRLLKEESVATMLALYAGTVPINYAHALVRQLEDKNSFNTNCPVPSVPINSPWYKPLNYWQGPSWININWLIIEGLKNYGFIDQAKKLRLSTLSTISNSGCYEYYNPENSNGLGASNFSWTAALAIDLALCPIN